MRRILVDYARARRAEKRGGPLPSVPLDEAFVFSEQRSPELLALDDALGELACVDPRQCQVVEMRFFAGMTEKEIAEVLEVSERTVKREWDHAKTWLYGKLAG
jgi:RNA polymerase sigma factor (TIGR02999 family)